MNQKQAKAFRAEVRRNGFHPREAKYRGGWREPTTLEPGCGRALYRQMKRDARRAAA